MPLDAVSVQKWIEDRIIRVTDDALDSRVDSTVPVFGEFESIPRSRKLSKGGRHLS